jgi:phytoene desaturase
MKVAKRTNRVIVVGAGLSGLACALHLSAAGREVTVIDENAGPGGSHGSLELDGFRFDTGPVTAFAPEAVAAPLHAVGEHVRDWIDFLPLEPLCRAHYPDGTSLDVSSDPYRTAAAIGNLCGGAEARAYLRYLRVARFRVPPELFLNDPRTLRLFGGAGLFGFAPAASGWYPRGGNAAVPRALCSVAEKHGVTFHFGTQIKRWETRGGEVIAVRAESGERFEADAFVFPTRPKASTGPSHLVLHVGARSGFSKIAHHNVHFGKPWQRSRYEVLVRGEMMTDPTIMVSAPSQTDPGAAPPGQHTFQIVVPVPNLKTAPIDWDVPATRGYAGEILATLEARGYLDLGADLSLSYVVTPMDWARQGMAYGIASYRQPPVAKLHQALSNAVVAGPGLIAGRRAAEKMVKS